VGVKYLVVRGSEYPAPIEGSTFDPGRTMRTQSKGVTAMPYKIVATWSAPKPEDEKAFEQHYWDVHVPRAAAVPNLERILLTKTDGRFEGAEPPYYRVAEMFFDSPSALDESSNSKEWAAMRDDAGQMIERFGVTLQVGLGEERDFAIKDK
jgi:uncharacterized protein (TIGR02118 family)